MIDAGSEVDERLLNIVKNFAGMTHPSRIHKQPTMTGKGIVNQLEQRQFHRR